MWEFVRQNQFVVGALTGSLASYLLGLLISHLRREKKWLGYSINSRNVVEKEHSKLAITYGGRDIVRLDSHSVRLRNIGNRALTNLPVWLEVKSTGSIIEHEVNSPAGGTFIPCLDSAQRLVITIDLLNPGEAFDVGLTVADAENGEIAVVARAEYLRVKSLNSDVELDEFFAALLEGLPLGFGFLGAYRLLARKHVRRQSRP